MKSWKTYSAYKMITQIIHIAISKNYIDWKQNQSNDNMETLQNLLSTIEIVYLIVGWIEQQQWYMALAYSAIFVMQELSIKLLTKKYKKYNGFLFIQQTSFTVWVLATLQNAGILYIFSIFYIIFISFYSKIAAKLAFWATYICLAIFVLSSNNLFEIIIASILILIIILGQEIQLINHFIRQYMFYSIIDSLPNAICILDSNRDSIVYNNLPFEQLAYKLNPKEYEQLIAPQTPEQIQLNFINNLQLEEMKHEGFQIQNQLPQIDDEGITDDQYKIIKIDYRKISTPTPIGNTRSQGLRKDNTKQYNLFTYFKVGDFVTNVERQSYTSNINLQIVLSHQPKSFALSALTKKRKKSSNYVTQKNCPSMKQMKSSMQMYQDIPIDSQQPKLTSPKNYESAILQPIYSSNEQLNGNNTNQVQFNDHEDHRISTTTHKLKFSVDIITIDGILTDDYSFQIYCLNELSPVLLQHKLKKLEAVKKNILRSISHELRTNLNAIDGYLQHAVNLLQNQPQIQRYLTLSQKYLTLQQYKLQDFFDYRDILEDKLILKEEPFNLNQTINQCVDLVRDQCMCKKIALNVEMPPSQIIVFGDSQRLSQVVLNLLCNSIRCTNSGGIIIKVTLTQVDNSMKLIDEEQPKGQSMVEVRVLDSGIGMVDEQLGVLTKKLLFINEDSKVSKTSVGIGVGLSVSNFIIRAMGVPMMNSLFVESKIGGGSQFYFYLNYKQMLLQSQDGDMVGVENKSDLNVRISPSKQKQHNTFTRIDLALNDDKCQCNKLLLVDDEQFNLEVLINFVTKLKYEYETANNGVQALMQLQNKHESCKQCLGYRAILMDINMPILDGWDTTTRIRQIEKQNKVNRKIPMIAITGYCSQSDQNKCMKIGFDAVIIKPAKQDKLIELFKQLNI